nr:hypothetical protein [Deinococcus apachensis]
MLVPPWVPDMRTYWPVPLTFSVWVSPVPVVDEYTGVQVFVSFETSISKALP